GQQVEGGGFFGEKRRMAEVVVEHLAAEADGRGRLGGGEQPRDRRQRVQIMVGHDEGRVPEILDLSRQVAPGGARSRVEADHAEPKRLGHPSYPPMASTRAVPNRSYATCRTSDDAGAALASPSSASGACG